MRLPRMLVMVATCLAAHAAYGQGIGAVGGVYIDPEGMLRETSTLTKDEQLKLLRQEVLESESADRARSASPLRKLSLKQLELAVAECHKQGTPLPAEVRYLAGLQQVQYVFFDLSTSDVILAGPAEAWRQLPTGEVVGQQSGQPVLHLDDLVVCLRHVFGEPSAPFLGCSIEPTVAGMKSYAAFLRSVGTIDGNRIPELLRGMERAMGAQDVKLYGLPESSRAALILLAADYRLKRISLGHDPAPIPRFTNYLDLAAKRQQSSRVPQHRFWFVGQYDSVKHTADKLAWTFVGTGVLVQTAPTAASFKAPAPAGAKPGSSKPGSSKPGSNTPGDKPSKTAQSFVDSFTRQFPEIAAQVPVFLELRNVINLAAVAGIIRQVSEEQTEKGGWTPGHFLQTKECALATYSVPTHVPVLANVRRLDGSWMFSVSGGVDINVARLIDPNRLQPADERTTSARSAALKLSATHWWWD